MLAMQAQDLPGSKWSVGLRHAAATLAGVDAAFDAGDIVRSWPMRGTLHVVAGEDLGWLLQLTAPRMLASAWGRRAALGITGSDTARAREIVTAELSGRSAATRQALLAALEAAGISTAGQRGYHLLGFLAQNGTLVLGPTEGPQQTFVLLDDWVPNPRRLERDEALGELALRYFRSHGPATAADLARWSGLRLADVRRGLSVCGPALTTLELDGVTYHLAPEAESWAAPTARVHLLPGFDELLLGYADRSAALAPERAAAVVPGSNGVFRPTIVADGTVVGTWKRTTTAREIVIETDMFERPPLPVEDGLADAVQAFGAFLGRPARLAGGRLPDRG